MKKHMTSFFSRFRNADAAKSVIGIIFFILVIYPVVRMLLFIDAESLQNAIGHPSFIRGLSNSVMIATTATFITILIAYALAWCLERVDMKGKGLFRMVLILPMLIPSISHGMGLIVLFGNNGIVTNFLNLTTSIYGRWGVICGSIMYAFPVAFLMFADVLKYEDAAPYEAASILGIPKHRQLASISMPFLRKPLISIAFSVFTMIITDYGVPLMVGGNDITIPVIMYQEVIGQLNFPKGAVYGVVLLVPALIAFVVDILNKDHANSRYDTRSFVLIEKPATRAFAYTTCIIGSLLAVLPIFAFVCIGFAKKYPIDLSLTIANIQKTLNMGAIDYLLNSVIIAIAVSIIGTAVSFVTAYLTARMKSQLSKFLHLISITSAAVPGIVLGLAYVIVFKGSFIYGTLVILIMVNVIHFIASPYLMMYNSMNKLNENLEAVGETLGIGRLRMIIDVFIPQVRSTIIEMISYFFVNSMMTISAVSFLVTTRNKPIALMINQFEAQMQLECAAIVSLTILCVNLLIKGTLQIVAKRTSTRKYEVNQNDFQEAV